MPLSKVTTRCKQGQDPAYFQLLLQKSAEIKQNFQKNNVHKSTATFFVKVWINHPLTSFFELFQLPHVFERPKLPEKPNLPNLTELPELPKLLELSEQPELPYLSEVAELPELSDPPKLRTIPEYTLSMYKAAAISALPLSSTYTVFFRVITIYSNPERQSLPSTSNLYYQGFLSNLGNLPDLTQLAELPELPELPQLPECSELPELPKLHELFVLPELIELPEQYELPYLSQLSENKFPKLKFYSCAT